ncbi:RES family NAD+ phosphorylase [Occallatibacter riparius]|uniref:RES family NAD+ phosphorylase n=1 Tax=Occallatibacter riparius TaxID=1002689 RepID=A0A9J7BVX3_9BACT|nr:RES family NAD+ phosphorylase [Occallatibacter riparius]UWZ85157.1 RES family NAD+ phosphorylase [Occallatibacter riparius]
MARLETIDRRDTHRLIGTKYPGKSVLETLPLPPNVLSDLSELDASTNERRVAEKGGNSAISPLELVWGFPEANVVNAAFTHPGTHGSRFNNSLRGAWYASVDLETSIQEVAFHKRQFVKDSRFVGIRAFEYADYLADFIGRFHFLEGDELVQCLQAGPIPACYAPSQALAGFLLTSKSAGIVYPSVRHAGGTCIVCFRPPLVHNPRRDRTCSISLEVGTDKVECKEIATALL